MRYPRDHKERTRARILDAACRVFRRRGYDGTGIDGVMREAGLTAGGFYAHFSSKEDLLAAALHHALGDTRDDLFEGLEGRESVDWLRAVVARYLSRAHRDDVVDGCALPALISEIPRSGPKAKAALEALLRELIKRVEAKFPHAKGRSAADRALATMALCIGGLALARAVERPALSNQILRACCRLAVPEVSPLPGKRPRLKSNGRAKASIHRET